MTPELFASDRSELATFRQLADEVCSKAAHYGKRVQGYRDPRLPLFSALAPEQQSLFIESLRLAHNSLDRDEEVFFEAEKRALWKSIRLLGLVPPPGLFEQLRPDRAIEIFSMDGAIIWRNLTCMDLCSYTIEEIACIGVWDRYQRAPGAFEQCIAKLQAMICGAEPPIADPNIPPYTMIETQSTDRLALMIKHELVCLLKDRSGALAGYLCMSSAQVIGSGIGANPPNHLSIVN